MTQNKIKIFVVCIVLSVLAFLSWRLLSTKAGHDEFVYPERTFTFPPHFVKDPGQAGKDTLDGIDSDHDGVRDDLQRWIYARFPYDPKKRGALKQAVVVFQDYLNIDESDFKQRRKVEDQMLKAMHCLDFRMGIENSNDELKYIQAKSLNTKLRTERYFEVSKAFEGEFFSDAFDSNESACEYDY